MDRRIALSLSPLAEPRLCWSSIRLSPQMPWVKRR
jgi:hypothetical protein